jgi:hypothetical protein
MQTTQIDTIDLKTKWDPIQPEVPESEVLSLILENPAWSVKRQQNRTQTAKPQTTHLILSGEHGGVLSIPDSDHETFMTAYCRDVARGIRQYMREEKTDVFPLAVDLDHKPKELEDRWKRDHLFVWVRTYQTVLRNCYLNPPSSSGNPISSDPFLCIVTKREGDFIYYQDESNHGVLRKKDFKQGYRLSFPNLLVSSERARMIRQCVLREFVSNGADCRFMFRLKETDLIGESVF